MTPSNDFTRPPETGRARLARRLAAVTVAGIVLAGAVRTLGTTGPGVWSSVRAAAIVALEEDDVDMRPAYSGGALLRPRGYDRWIPVGMSLGLSYSAGAAPHDTFHQVFLTPLAYEAFERTGSFPEGTMLALELRAAGSRVLPARSGLFADARVGLEFAVKDRRAAPDGWAYYSFDDGTRASAVPLPASACSACHRQHARTDNVFTQFYPRLRKSA